VNAALLAERADYAANMQRVRDLYNRAVRAD
jgi:hypothetical protein